MKENPFTKDYYLRGPATGLSNYENYRWLGEPTMQACNKIMEYLGMRRGESVVDIGAALGFYVKAFRLLGMRAYGVDISEWAVASADPLIRKHMSTTMPDRAFDWATLKDVCEHLEYRTLVEMIQMLNCTISKGAFILVPLAEKTDGAYIRPEDERDVTHLIRWTLDDWLNFLEINAPDFNVNGSYHIYGIKPASQTARHSCGFFTLTRP